MLIEQELKIHPPQSVMSQIRSIFETNSHLCWSPFNIKLPLRPSVCNLCNDSIITDRNSLNFDFGNSIRNCRHISVFTKIKQTTAIPSFEGHSASLLKILSRLGYGAVSLVEYLLTFRRFLTL